MGNPAVSESSPPAGASWLVAAQAALAVLMGGLASACLQYSLREAVGPLMTVAGSGSVLAWALFRVRGPQLQHPRLLGLASRASCINAILLSIAFLAFPSKVRSTEVLLAGTLATCVLGFLGTLALVAMVGSSLDHYVKIEAPPPESGEVE